MFYGTLNERQCSESFQAFRPPVKLLNFESHLVAFPCSALIKNRTLWKSIEKYRTFKNPRYKFSIDLEHFNRIKMKEFSKLNKSLFVRFVLKESNLQEVKKWCSGVSFFLFTQNCSVLHLALRQTASLPVKERLLFGGGGTGTRIKLWKYWAAFFSRTLHESMSGESPALAVMEEVNGRPKFHKII